MKLCPFLLFGFAGLGAWLGCGSTVDTSEAAGSGGSNAGGAMASSTSSTSAAGGAGATGGGTSGDGGSITFGTGGAGGSADPCPQAYLTIITQGGDPPPVLSLNHVCPNAWGSDETGHAVGYEGYSSGQPGAMQELFIEGCQGQQGPAHLQLEVPLFDVGAAPTDEGQFQLSGVAWTTLHGVNVTITSFGGQHQLIEGSYDGEMSDGSAQHHVSGTFGVCRVSDFLPP